MHKLQLLPVLTAKIFYKFLLVILFTSLGVVHMMWNQKQFQSIRISLEELQAIQQEKFWFDLVAEQNISVLTHLPSHVLQSHKSFWLKQFQTIGKERSEKKVESLSKIMESQMEKILQNVDCSNRLTLNCGHHGGCGFGCQFHHRAFCVLVSYTLGIPLIHNTSFWPYKCLWGSRFKTLGSDCKENSKTVFMKFSPKELPTLSMSFLFISIPHRYCKYRNSCVHHRKVRLKLFEGIVISRELLKLLKLAKHTNPFLWYMGQFMRYSLRYNEQTLDLLKDYEKNFTFSDSHQMLGIQARRTDKITEYNSSYHSVNEYMQKMKVHFQTKGNRQYPKTVFVASDDHTFLKEIQQMWKSPKWKILGFESNYTMSRQGERNSPTGLLSVVRDVHFLAKCDFMICGLTSNICRLILETMATRFHNPETRLYSLDGNYVWHMWSLKLNLTLVSV